MNVNVMREELEKGGTTVRDCRTLQAGGDLNISHIHGHLDTSCPGTLGSQFQHLGPVMA